MALSKIDTAGLAADAVDNTIVDLAGNYTYSGDVTIPGHVVAVQQAVTTAQQLSASQTSLVDVTGATLTITPKSTSSKILVMTDMGAYFNNGSTFPILDFALVRGSTVIHQKAAFYFDARSTGTVFGQQLSRTFFHYLDSPATTSATTYKLQYKSSSGGSGHPTLGIEQGSVFTIMEIAQ